MLRSLHRRRLHRLTAVLVVLTLLAACGAEGDDAANGDANGQRAGDVVGEGGHEEVMLEDDQITDISERGLTFGMSTNNMTDDFSRTIVSGAQKAADDLGIELIAQSADFDAQTQLAQIDSFLQQGVDGIYLIAVDSDAVSTGVLAANEAGVPVLIIGGPPTRGEVITVLNSGSYEGTKESAEMLAEAMGDDAQAAILRIPLAIQVIRERDRGVDEAFEEHGIETVADFSSFTQEELVSSAESMIESNPDLDGIYATWSLAIYAALAAVEQSGRDIFIAGHDAERPGFEAFHEGNTNLVNMTAQTPYQQGQIGVHGLSQVILGNTLVDAIDVPNPLVTAENYEEMWDYLYPELDPPWETEDGEDEDADAEDADAEDAEEDDAGES
ncbi:MAG TPA: sugar ABC transporter substrate-binding protein [Egibacteraceae bacterium]|nr:sugar ABC transporter substrate-binding protein [Egibacteraceae bacterium]